MSKACFVCGEVERVTPAGFGFLCQHDGKPICDLCAAIVMDVARKGLGPITPTVVRELRKVVAARDASLAAALGGEDG